MRSGIEVRWPGLRHVASAGGRGACAGQDGGVAREGGGACQGSRKVRVVSAELSELAARLSNGMAAEFDAQGLTTPRAELLWRLHPTGPQTQRALSDALRCTPRNVTGLVDALEAAELVRREPHPTDRRASLVALTEDGHETVAGWRSRYDEFAHLLFGDLDSDDPRAAQTDAVHHVLERVRTTLPVDR